MQFTDNLRKSSASKLLPFRSPSSASRGAGAPLALDREQIPTDISMLRRPSATAAAAGTRIHEQEGLAHDARNLLTGLELFSGLLARPGVLSEGNKHFSDDLKAMTGPLSTLIERMAIAPLLQVDPEYGSRLDARFVATGSKDGAVAGASDGALPSAHPGGHPGAGRMGEPVFMREPLRPELRSSGTVHRGEFQEGPRNSQGELTRDAGVMVKSCERLLGAMAGAGVSLHISYEQGLGELTLGSEALIRVLVNLVKNASDAMPGGGRIAITVRKGLGPFPCVLLAVEDNGVGIPAHAMGQLFQAGFSSKKPRQAWPASAHQGLGLTIVRDLVEDAGGSVRVCSTLRKGSTFEIKLPCRRQ